MKSAYIITRPLQYINATNIPDDAQKDCFIIDFFSDSENFYKVISKYSAYWNNVELHKSRYTALFKIIRNKNQYKSLFIDSDYGIIITFLFLLIPSIVIYTYEEGYGSYRYIRDNKRIKVRLKSVVYSLMGSKNWIGGNICTTGIYLYHPEVFSFLIKNNSKKLLKFKTDFNSHLKTLNEINLFYGSTTINNLKNKQVVVYLTTWTINPTIDNQISQYQNYFKILKPHPHIKEQTVINCKFDLIVKSALPAEILLNHLIDICKDLVIIHENSSALMYLSSRRYKEINISASPRKNDYESIINAIGGCS